MSRKLVMRVSSLVDRHTSRRGFLRSLVMSATAIAFAPAYLVRPIAAEAAIITCLGLRCSSWSACCDGWTEFCCRLTGENMCPPGTVVGGWWKVNNSSFCSYDEPRPRYYIDCNVACVNAAGCRPGGLCRRSETAAQCRCPDGCDTRKVDCVQFRYGQCNQQTCVGPIRCRVVTCVPPWQWDPTCSRRPVLTSEATRHHDRPCLHDWFNDVPPNAFYAGAVRWMSDRGIASGVTDDLFGPDEPIRWEDFATLLWSYATGRTTEPPSPLEEANPRTDYEKAVDWMVENRIALGQTVRYPDPAGHITRAEAISVLHGLAAVTNAASQEEPTPKDLYPERELTTERLPFPDVVDGAWYGEAVDWAAGQGIVWWSPPDPFHPDQVVTRSSPGRKPLSTCTASMSPRLLLRLPSPNPPNHPPMRSRGAIRMWWVLLMRKRSQILAPKGCSRVPSAGRGSSARGMGWSVGSWLCGWSVSSTEPTPNRLALLGSLMWTRPSGGRRMSNVWSSSA